jgi:hypothetical protein
VFFASKKYIEVQEKIHRLAGQRFMVSRWRKGMREW